MRELAKSDVTSVREVVLVSRDRSMLAPHKQTAIDWDSKSEEHKHWLAALIYTNNRWKRRVLSLWCSCSGNVTCEVIVHRESLTHKFSTHVCSALHHRQLPTTTNSCGLAYNKHFTIFKVSFYWVIEPVMCDSTMLGRLHDDYKKFPPFFSVSVVFFCNFNLSSPRYSIFTTSCVTNH